MTEPARPDPSALETGGSDRAVVRRAHRVELAVYVFAAASLVVLGMFLTSKILNWIIGPVYVIAVVTLVTPLALRLAGVPDPYRRRKASEEPVRVEEARP